MIVAELPAGAVLIERFTAPAPKQLRYPARLQMRPVRTQPAAILDFAMVQDMLAVLEPSRIAMYAKDQQSSVSIAPAAPMPRDPRGRLLAREATLEAYLPGTTCVVQMQTPPAIACRPGTTSWREGHVSVSWAPRRNYLVVNEGEKSADGFGSDMAPITNACSAGAALIVASSAGDADVVQAVAGLQPLTERVAVPGPVVALWTAETDKEVSLVVRNNRTGEYEASRVSLVCDR
jgi:hypothetical protein